MNAGMNTCMFVFSLAKPIVRELHTLGSLSEGSTIGIKLLIEANSFNQSPPPGTHISVSPCATHTF